jgi:serine protease Do
MLHRHRASILAALSALLVASTIGATANAQTGQSPNSNGPVPVVNAQTRAADLVEPAVVWVRADWEAWVITDFLQEPLHEVWTTGCSGFVVNPDGAIVTAGHCVDDGWDGARGDALDYAADDLISKGYFSESDRDALIKAVRSGALRWTIEGQDANSPPERDVHVQLGGGPVRWSANAERAEGISARVLDFLPWSKGDVALLKVDSENLPVVPLAPKSDIQVGQELLSIGYPAGQAADGASVTLTDRNGQVNSVDSTANGPGNRFYETSAALSHGMSGGPGVDLRGRVIGLNSFSAEDGTAYDIVPSSVILELLNRNNVKNQQGRVDQLYRQGLESYYQGYHTDAIAAFDQVLSLLPNNQQVLSKKARAADLKQRYGDQPKPSPPPEPKTFAWTLPAIAAAAVLVLLSALLVGRRMRRRRAQARWRRQNDGGGYPAVAPPSAPAPSSATVPPTSNGSAFRDWAAGEPATEPGESGAQTQGTPAPTGTGTVTGTRVSEEMCPTCGREPGPDAAFCPGCGTRLGSG